MSDSDPEFKILKRELMRRHLEQLQTLELDTNKPRVELPVFASFDDLVRWTNASKAQIDKGISNRVYGGLFGSAIDFNNAFVAFMESAAMYLRDSSQVIEAVNVYRSNKDSGEAFELLEKSHSQISELANMWGMSFIQICVSQDLVTVHPDGHSWLVGPFCGAFIPKDYKTSDKPFLGVAFKGTSSVGEAINDLAAMSTVSPPSWLWKSPVSKGFYYPIFSTYSQTPSVMPFNMIRQAIQDLANGCKATMITHITGHSLGGAYAILTLAELSIQGTGISKADVGDLYTFGAPRVGRGDFAKNVKAAVESGTICKGSPWRVANMEDPVARVPASPPWPKSSDPFVHINSGYKIYPDRAPVLKPSEIGTYPTWPLVLPVSNHYTNSYYPSLVYATTGRPPPSDAVLPERERVSVVGAVAKSLAEAPPPVLAELITA